MNNLGIESDQNSSGIPKNINYCFLFVYNLDGGSKSPSLSVIKRPCQWTVAVVNAIG